MDDSKKRLGSILCLTGVVLGCGGYYAFSGESTGDAARPALPHVAPGEVPVPKPTARPIRQPSKSDPDIDNGVRRPRPRVTPPKNVRPIRRGKPIKTRKIPITPGS